MYGDEQPHSEGSNMNNRLPDIHRRKIMFSSMQGKLRSAYILIQSAIEAAENGKNAHNSLPINAEVSQQSSEAVFAAVDEAIQYLNNIKSIAVKTGSTRKIPVMEKYHASVEAMNNGIHPT